MAKQERLDEPSKKGHRHTYITIRRLGRGEGGGGGGGGVGGGGGGGAKAGGDMSSESRKT